MAKIPQSDPLDTLNDKLELSQPRDYLGLSQVGHPCHRFLQYYHYWAFDEHHSAQLRRLFQVGHDAEDGMIEDLKKVGIIATDRQETITGVGGHWKGHTDGKGIDVEDPTDEFLIEFKTHNDKSFKEVKKLKVLKSKPVHYDQMQAYMGYLGHERGLYMALNKNTSQYYFEWIEFDEERFDDIKRKQAEIIMSDVLLPRVGNDSPTWFECKMCSASQECFGRREVKDNCRTCQYVDVLPDGEWACGFAWKDKLLNVKLSTADQRVGCTQYKLGDMFK